MSLATLKKKTNAKYNNASVGASGFSLNGVHRNQGYIGQTSLSRTIIGTPMKGNVPRGHGGCCGKYNDSNIIKPLHCLEDSNTVKRSVLSSKGMLRLKNKWANRGGEHAPVKPDSNNNNNFSSMYTSYKRRQTLIDLAPGTSCEPKVGVVKHCSCSSDVIKDCKCHTKHEIVEPKEMFTNIDQGEYIFKKTFECVSNDPMQLVSGNKKHPFTGMGPFVSS
tara:strand:+ start:2033 stop:2692 length:660 start_codon:yes stop_codon:yes gene_type:complete